MIDCDTTKKIGASAKNDLQRGGALVLIKTEILNLVGIFREKFNLVVVVDYKMTMGANEPTLELKLHLGNLERFNKSQGNVLR